MACQDAIGPLSLMKCGFSFFWPLIALEGYKECRLRPLCQRFLLFFFITSIVVVAFTQQDANIQDPPEEK